MEIQEIQELLYQSLETEMGGVNIYKKAIECAVNSDLKKEWEKYLEQTTTHVEIMTNVLEGVGLDPTVETPGRAVVRHIGESLVMAMDMAQKNAEPNQAEIVAAECVTLAETKDHLNWELIGECAKKAKGDVKKILQAAFEEVEEQEDEHIYHTQGWTRELWIDSLGMPAVLPPPEEEKDVKTAIGAQRAKNARTSLL